MKCFDAHGNFIPTSERLAMEKELEDSIVKEFTTTTEIHPIRLIYHLTPTTKNKKSNKRYFRY